MSWLKQSSSSSLKESASRPKTATNASPSSSSVSRHSQNTITRILACGTVYLTHTLSVPSAVISPSLAQDAEDLDDTPAKTTNVRAKQVLTQRGGPAVNVLSILAQFTNATSRGPTAANRPPVHTAQVNRTVIECALVSPLGSDAAGRALMHELELEGVRTRFCKVHPAGVPSAFVLRSDDTPSRTIINHNPLPELTHEDFVTILGPILVPEHYHGIATHHWHPHPNVPQLPPVHAVFGPGPGLPPLTTQPAYATPSPQNGSLPTSPLPPSTPGLPSNAPFTVFHLTGRSPSADAITLMNLTGVDGLARDRSWRDKSTFSLDCTAPVANELGKLARQQMFPHVDVIFYSKAYARSVNPSTPAEKLTPRSFLLSQVPLVAPHALLFIFWDHDGGALLSVPTREYLQSSTWTEATPSPAPTAEPPIITEHKEQETTYPPLNPGGDIRPETTLSLGSSDPRYQEFGTFSSIAHAPNDNRRIPSQWANVQSDETASEGPLSPGILPSRPPSGNILDHVEAQGRADSPGFSAYDFGYAGFVDTTPDTSWDYRANRTAVIYDSGDESETDYGETLQGAGGYSRGAQGLALQTSMARTNAGPSGVMISEGVALSPSDVDSDVDANIAAGASRFVMEERIRRVYGPLEGDQIESDALDNETPDQSAENGNDSDATESGELVTGPTRIGKLKKERLREMEEQEKLEALEVENPGRRSNESGERDDAASIRSGFTVPIPPKPLPPIPPYVIEAWQAGLLYALTRHVLPGRPYVPTINMIRSHENLKATKKIESISPSDWAWKWRLDECLRFAAELAGRRARKNTMEGLAREMEESGWLS